MVSLKILIVLLEVGRTCAQYDYVRCDAGNGNTGYAGCVACLGGQYSEYIYHDPDAGGADYFCRDIPFGHACATQQNGGCSHVAACSGPTSCAGTEYMSRQCSASESSLCSACTQCTASEYISQPCSGLIDTKCVQCSVCPAGTYQSGACISTTDTQCAVPCAPGTYKYDTGSDM
jgi:hypothetical protein